MRSFILLLIGLSSFLSKAQDSSLVTEYFFCGSVVSVPSDCQYEETYMNYNGKDRLSGAIIKQGSQFIQWTYYNYIPDQVKGEFVEQMLDQSLTQKEEKWGRYRKNPRKYISLDQSLDGWLIELKNREISNKCFLFASGVINEEHVIIYCGLTQKPKNNNAIPEFMRQLIQFE